MYDTIIIGAGLSGLQTALSIHKAGHSVLVFEARDRVGGKTCTVPLETGGCVDLGAAWINDTNQHRMYSYTQRFGLELIKQNTEGNALLHDIDGKIIPFAYGFTPPFENKFDTHDLNRIRDLIQDAAIRSRESLLAGLPDQQLRELDEVTLHEFVKHKGATERTIKMVNIWTQVMLGVDSSEMSAAFFVDYCAKGGGLMQMRSDSKHGGQYLRFRTDRKWTASNSTKLGIYTKLIAIYREPWWIDAKLCGLILSYEGPIVVARDTSSPADSQYSLTCFVNGSVGKKWSKLTPYKRQATVLQHLHKVTGDAKALEPIDVLECQWMNEIWSQGAVCPISAPGVMSSVGSLWKAPVGNVHFVGTEFAREWKEYMEGALSSGEDGAKEVLEILENRAKL